MLMKHRSYTNLHTTVCSKILQFCILKILNCQQQEWMLLTNIPPQSILFSCYVIPFDEYVELNAQCISGIFLSKYLFSILLDFKTMFYGFHELWPHCIVRPYQCTYKSCYQSSINLSLLHTHTHTHTSTTSYMFHVTYPWCFCRGSWTYLDYTCLFSIALNLLKKWSITYLGFRNMSALSLPRTIVQIYIFVYLYKLRDLNCDLGYLRNTKK